MFGICCITADPNLSLQQVTHTPEAAGIRCVLPTVTIVSSFIASEGIHPHFLFELHHLGCWGSDTAFASFPWLDEGTSISGRQPGLVKLQMLVSVIPCVCALETWLALNFYVLRAQMFTGEKHRRWSHVAEPTSYKHSAKSLKGNTLQSSPSCISGY